MDELAAEVEQLKKKLDLLALPDTRRGLPDPGAGQRRAFMVMPFGLEALEIVYEEFVRPTLQDVCGIVCVRGDDIFGSNVIMDDVSAAIAASDLLVADLTGRNANVFYEVGIGHALNKPVLLLAQSLDDVPFDLRHRRVLLYEYSPKGCKRLEQSVAEHVRDMLKATE
jgi:hypothetical protein